MHTTRYTHKVDLVRCSYKYNFTTLTLYIGLIAQIYIWRYVSLLLTKLHIKNVRRIQQLVYFQSWSQNNNMAGGSDYPRGQKIRFVRGTYIGHEGWINLAQEITTNKSTPVIVHKWKKKDGTVIDKTATVRNTSFRIFEDAPPDSHAAAILRQQPKIEKLMDDLCRKLAMCAIDPQDTTIVEIFREKLQEATDVQEAKGAEALWYDVNYSFA